MVASSPTRDNTQRIGRKLTNLPLMPGAQELKPILHDSYSRILPILKHFNFVSRFRCKSPIEMKSPHTLTAIKTASFVFGYGI